MTISASALAAISLLLAAFTDLRWRIIPNRLVLLVVLAGIVVRLSGCPQALLGSLAVAGSIFAGMLLLFHFGLVGGGDVKLLSAAVLLSTPAEVAGQIVLIALSGGAMALAFLLWRICVRLYRRNSVPTDRDALPIDRTAPSPTAEQKRERSGFQGDGIPYGVAICIGTLANMALSK